MGSWKEKLGYFLAGALFGSVLAFKYSKAEQKIKDEETKEKMAEVEAKAEAAEKAIKEYRSVNNREEVTTTVHIEDGTKMNERPDYEILTPDRYNDNELEYEQRDLTYHSGDSVLEDNGVVEDNIDDIIGPGTLDLAGRYCADNEVYVRNNLLQMEYAVTIEDDFFYEDDPDEY